MSSDIDSAIADLERSVSRKKETDRIMSFPKWIILSIVTFGIAGIVMLYFLIERRNEHFKRQKRLVEGIETIMKAHAEKNNKINPETAKISSLVKDVRDEEGERSSILWVALAVLTGGVAFIAGFYVMYFLSSDLYKHFKRQNEIIVEYISAIEKLGVDTSSLMNLAKTQYPVPKKEFVLYIALSIITFGIFAIYWLYTIFRDWNNHFQSQWTAEDQILASIRSLPSPDSKPKKKASK